MIDLVDYDNNDDSDSNNFKKEDDKKDVKYNEEEEIVSSSEEENLEKEANESKKEEEEDDSPAISENSKQDIDPIDFIDENDEFKSDQLNELLFCVQGIGEFKRDEKGKKTKHYEKGIYCEPSLRDIHRFLRKDDIENPISRYAILNWKVCDSDIIPLLLTYENNEKIALLCLVILVDLTEPLPDVIENREQLNEMIFNLVQSLITNGVIELIGRGLSDATKNLIQSIELKEELKKEQDEMIKKKKELEKQQQKEETVIDTNTNMNVEMKDQTIVEDKKEEDLTKEYDEEMKQKTEMKRQIAEMELKSTRLIELLLALLKQLISIYSVNNLPEASTSYSSLLTRFAKLKIFDAITYYTSLFNNPTSTSNPFVQSISSSLLSIIFYLTRLFTPKSVLDNSKPVDSESKPMTEFDRLVEKERLQEEERRKMLSTRPNAFGTRIKIFRPIDGSSFVVSNVNQLMNNPNQLITEKTNTYNQQKHGRKGRRKIYKNKKVPMSKIAEEIKMINDYKLKKYFSTSPEISQASFNETMQAIKKFFDEYKKNCLNGIAGYYFIMLGREDELDTYDVYNFVNVLSFFIEYNRLSNYETIFAKEEKKFDLSCIRGCITNNMIDYMYNYLLEQTVMKEKTERKIYMIYPILKYLQQVVYVAFDSYKYPKSEEDLNLNINVVIQDTLFSKDFTKIIKILFTVYNDSYHPYEILYDLIEFCEIYFSALELFSKKRNLKIKKIKKKKKKKEEDDEEKYLKKLEKQMLKEDGNISSESESNSIDEDDFIEQDLNVFNECKCLVDYEIVDKIMLLFKNRTNYSSFDLTSQLLDIKNSDRSLLKFVTKIIDRIANKTKCIWIFYHIEYLLVFNSLLNNKFFKSEEAFKPLRHIIRNISHEYFELVKKNPMLPIESLFHFNSLNLIDNIYNNYEVEGTNEEIKKLNEADFDFDDNKEFVPEEGEEYYKPEPKVQKKEKKEYTEWNVEQDKKLVEIYFNSAIQNETGEIINIDEVVNKIKEELSEKEIDDIKHRMKKLKVKKGKKEKSLKKIDKIYHLGKYSKEENNKKKHIELGSITDTVLQLSEKSKDETYKNKLKYVMNGIIRQIETTKLRKEYNPESKTDCTIIPITEEEIEILNDEDFVKLLSDVGFSKNESTEQMKIDENTDGVDLSIIQDKLEQCLKMINENVEERTKEREEKKAEHKKKHKHKKHNFISEFVMDEEKGNEDIKVEEDIDKLLDINTSSGKKKKLKKKKNFDEEDNTMQIE